MLTVPFRWAYLELWVSIWTRNLNQFGWTQDTVSEHCFIFGHIRIPHIIACSRLSIVGGKREPSGRVEKTSHALVSPRFSLAVHVRSAFFALPQLPELYGKCTYSNRSIITKVTFYFEYKTRRFLLLNMWSGALSLWARMLKKRAQDCSLFLGICLTDVTCS